MNTRRDEASTLHVRAPGQPCAYNLPVEHSNDHELVRLLTLAELLHGPRGLIRQHGALDADPAFEVRVALGAPNLDHPDLFSFPCCFA